MTSEIQGFVTTAQSAEKLGIVGVLFLVLLGLVAYNYFITRDIKRTLEKIDKTLETQSEILNLQLSFFKEHLITDVKREITELKGDVKELLEHCKENNAIKYGRRLGDSI